MKIGYHPSLLVLGSALILLLNGCGHLFYYPTAHKYVDVRKINPPPQQVEFKNKDGKKLIGWYFRGAPKPKAKILFFHGNAQNISSHFLALHWILDHGFDFFIFDYPGYGDSEGEPNRKSTTDSGQMALEWIAQQSPDIPIVIFGQSLGGNIAMYTAANNTSDIPICLVAVESTFKSYRKVGQRALSAHWFTWPLQWMPYLMVGESDSAIDRIAKIAPTPLLVIHGDEDPIVKISNGEDVFAAAKEPKEFWKIPRGLHIQAFFGKEGPEYKKKFVEKMASSCSK